MDDYFRELVARRRAASLMVDGQSAGTVSGQKRPVPVRKPDESSLPPSASLPSPESAIKASTRSVQPPETVDGAPSHAADLHTVRVSDASTATELATTVEVQTSHSGFSGQTADGRRSVEGVPTSVQSCILSLLARYCVKYPTVWVCFSLVCETGQDL